MKNNKKFLHIIIPAAVIVVLVSYAAFVLIGICHNVLITAQDRNPFAADSLYFNDLIARPFGLIEYVGGFLTQFFYYPALGATMLIAMWLLIAFAGIKAFKLEGAWRSLTIIPVACLMASVVDLGYWIYCLMIPGYWFSQTLAYLCLLLLLWASNSTPRRFRFIWYIVICFAGFPVFGWITYLFAVGFALSQLNEEAKGKIEGVVVLIAACVAPLFFRFVLYDEIPVNDIYTAGFPLFKTTTDSSLRPVYPFFILVVATVIMSFGRVLPALKKVPAWAAYIVVGIVSMIAVWQTIFKDANYLYEMKMTQATMSDDWQSVIRTAERTKSPSHTMVMLKNIALLNTGKLGDRSFELGNDGMDINNPDSLNVNIMHIAAPVIYYNYGKANYAMRWCMEMAVPYGFSPFYMKMFARCAQVTGEKKLAQRYINRLHSLLFYKNWQPSRVSSVVGNLYSVFTDSLDSDGSDCEPYIINSFSSKHNTKSPYCTELSLLYSMIDCNPENFWTSFADYLSMHKGRKIPTQYEEACCLFRDQSPSKVPFNISVTPSVADRYKEFMNAGSEYAQSGLDEKATRALMRKDWGGTYWWFNAFSGN